MILPVMGALTSKAVAGLMIELPSGRKRLGVDTVPVLVALLAQSLTCCFLRLPRVWRSHLTFSLLPKILPVYKEVITELKAAGATWIQLDEPVLVMDLEGHKLQAFTGAYAELESTLSGLNVLIHTHMCYSHFNDIIHSIIDMDADVITIENSRSDEKLLSVFREGVKYGAGIGLGVYDIHSPRIPSSEEIADRVNKILAVLEQNILWANPDCGLKTRKYTEVKPASKNMVDAAKLIRSQLASAK
ncbi:hypothetical protein Bca4012_045910 [Brassica carinata]